VVGSEILIKFLLDYLIAIESFVFLSPIFFVANVLVKLSSPGSINHKRLILGMNGKHFYAHKFRTMVSNGDEVLENYPE